MACKFSVVTINFNNAVGLEKTIQSVIAQNYEDYEFLIIDGGSTDGSLEIIQKYSSHISLWKSESDKGIFDALNKGIRLSKGEFLLFMNSGDCFYNSSVLEVYDKHINNVAQIYYGNCLGRYKNGQSLNIISPDNLDIKFWLFLSINHQSTIIKRTLFDLYGFYDDNLTIVSDWKWFFELFDKYQVKFQKINEFVSIYDMHGVSSDAKYWNVHLKERENVINDIFPSYWSTYLDLKQYYKTNPEDTKRQKHFDLIKKYPFLYRFLKIFMSMLLVFIPQKNRIFKL